MGGSNTPRPPGQTKQGAQEQLWAQIFLCSAGNVQRIQIIATRRKKPDRTGNRGPQTHRCFAWFCWWRLHHASNRISSIRHISDPWSHSNMRPQPRGLVCPARVPSALPLRRPVLFSKTRCKGTLHASPLVNLRTATPAEVGHPQNDQPPLSVRSI